MLTQTASTNQKDRKMLVLKFTNLFVDVMVKLILIAVLLKLQGLKVGQKGLAKRQNDKLIGGWVVLIMGS